MMDGDNAAGRLHDALEAYQEGRSNSHQQAPVDIWQEVLECESKFHTMLELQALGAMVPGVVWWAENEGPERLRAAVLRHAPTWMSVLSPGLTNPVSSTAYRVGADALTPLASAAALMDSNKNQRALTATERQAALDQLRELRDAISQDAELPDDLRRALLDRLRDVEAALETWRAGGDDALAASLERLAGVVSLGVAGMRGQDGKQEYPPILKRVAGFVGGVYQTIAGTVTLKEGAQLALYAGEAFGALPPGTAGSLGP